MCSTQCCPLDDKWCRMIKALDVRMAPRYNCVVSSDVLPCNPANGMTHTMLFCPLLLGAALRMGDYKLIVAGSKLPQLVLRWSCDLFVPY